jgi:hypothetical protein
VKVKIIITVVLAVAAVYGAAILRLHATGAKPV